MKQKYLILTGIVLSFFMLQSVVLSADLNSRNNDFSCGMHFGIMPIRDNSKIFIIDVLKNSPAEKQGLKLGDEIVKINNIKVKKFKSINDVNNLFEYRENVTLTIRNDMNSEREIFLIKSFVCIPKKKEDPLYNTYWHQIYTNKEDLDFLYDRISRIYSISNKLSRSLRRKINALNTPLNNWMDKKIKFTNYYNACIKATKTEEELHSCLVRSVNNIQSEIAYEKEIAAKMRYLQIQQQMQNQQNYALYNYADALRNQNVNVHHSGTINQNMYIRGIYRHNIYSY